MAELTIEEASVGDAPSLLRLHRAVIAEQQWFISEPDEVRLSIDAKIREIRSIQREPSAVCLVARRASELLGFLTLRPGPLRRMKHVSRLEVMVGQAHRGEGIGRALVAAAIAWGAETEAVEKLSLSVFSDNARAIALYEASGFIVEGRREREYRMSDGSYRGDVLMSRFV